MWPFFCVLVSIWLFFFYGVLYKPLSLVMKSHSGKLLLWILSPRIWMDWIFWMGIWVKGGLHTIFFFWIPFSAGRRESFFHMTRLKYQNHITFFFRSSFLRASGGCVVFNISELTRLLERGYVIGGNGAGARMTEVEDEDGRRWGWTSAELCLGELPWRPRGFVETNNDCINDKFMPNFQ